MRAISLFSGAGGFELGLERAGIETVLQAENDPWCLSVLERHWPDCERVQDVHDVGIQIDGGLTIAGHGNGLAVAEGGPRRRAWDTSSVDLVYGGFPCQDLSVAGARAGLGGSRSSLWHEFHRVLSELRPRWCLIENVPGLLSSSDGRDMATIVGGLGELGYGWAYRILDARFFGVPQRRRRVFIVGCLGNQQRAAKVLALCESCARNPQARPEARERLTAPVTNGAREPGIHLVAANPDGIGRPLVARASGYRMDLETENFLVANSLEASNGHHGYRGDRGDNSSNLIAGFYSHRGQNHDTAYTEDASPPLLAPSKLTNIPNTPAISGGMGVRRLTPLECERLMGWPDEHTRYTADGKEISDSHRYRLCGNGVVAPVAEWLGHRLMAA